MPAKVAPTGEATEARVGKICGCANGVDDLVAWLLDVEVDEFGLFGSLPSSKSSSKFKVPKAPTMSNSEGTRASREKSFPLISEIRSSAEPE